MTQAVLHLASASPRRRDILNSLGIAHSFAGVDIDESARDDENARDLVARVAAEKALAVGNDRYQGLPILAADTIVVVDEQVFGKPESEDSAVAMLGTLSGRTHQVMTAVALRHREDNLRAISVTDVRFREILPGEARAYWHSGEPAGKAGAYAIQGYAGIFVECLSGSYSGVVGLPVFETARLLAEVGIRVLAEEVRS